MTKPQFRPLIFVGLALLVCGGCVPSKAKADTTFLGLKQAQNVKTGWGSPGDNRTTNGNVLSPTRQSAVQPHPPLRCRITRESSLIIRCSIALAR